MLSSILEYFIKAANGEIIPKVVILNQMILLLGSVVYRYNKLLKL